MFVIDLSHLPQPTLDDPMVEVESSSFRILASNMSRGFYPLVTESYNTKCERKAFGMGPSDQNGHNIVRLSTEGQRNARAMVVQIARRL